jgi:exo-beta-1,3-glucanase (GH17 family)
MAIIAAGGFSHIRTYGVDGGNQWNVEKATKHGLKLAVGVWVDPNDAAKANAQIDLALGQAQTAALKYGKALELDLVIGNEVDRTDVARYSPEQIHNAMAYANSKKPGYVSITARVTTCFSGTVLANKPEWSKVVDYCDTVVYLTVYPWYAGQGIANPDNIDPQMQWSWDNGLRQVAQRGKQVLIAEIGWPSAGRQDATVENERINYGVTKKWVTSGPHGAFDTFWFEMFDEPWKTGEGAQGPHWGLCNSGPSPQPKFKF